MHLKSDSHGMTSVGDFFVFELLYRLCTKFEFKENMFVLVCVARWIWGVPYQSKMVPASHNSSPKVVCLVLYPNMRLYFYQCIILWDTGTVFFATRCKLFPSAVGLGVTDGSQIFIEDWWSVGDASDGEFQVSLHCKVYKTRSCRKCIYIRALF